jgi:hypothetical protein
LIILMSAGCNRIVIIPRELPRTENAGCDFSALPSPQTPLREPTPTMKRPAKSFHTGYTASSMGRSSSRPAPAARSREGDFGGARRSRAAGALRARGGSEGGGGAHVLS